MAILDGVYGKSRHSQSQGPDPSDILYVVHGKEIPPFQSIWFCGVPVDKVEAAKEAFRKAHGPNSVGMPAAAAAAAGY